MNVLNFGSLNIDHVYQVTNVVRPGETISSHNLEYFCGGKGLNQSIALAKAGAHVTNWAGNQLNIILTRFVGYFFGKLVTFTEHFVRRAVMQINTIGVVNHFPCLCNRHDNHKILLPAIV